tara:strand:- start:3746 stop:4030 length:285 start_codon:yes stop_codon:yes gene_type:complete
MAEVLYKGSLYGFYKSESNRNGAWICKEGHCIGQLTRSRYIRVPMQYWGELKEAAITAGYSADYFAPVAAPEKKSGTKSKRAAKKPKNPSISIF